MRCLSESRNASSWCPFPTTGSPGAGPAQTRGNIARRHAEQVSFFCSQGGENMIITTEAFERVPDGWMDDVAALRRRRPPCDKESRGLPTLGMSFDLCMTWELDAWFGSAAGGSPCGIESLMLLMLGLRQTLEL